MLHVLQRLILVSLELTCRLDDLVEVICLLQVVLDFIHQVVALGHGNVHLVVVCGADIDASD